MTRAQQDKLCSAIGGFIGAGVFFAMCLALWDSFLSSF